MKQRAINVLLVLWICYQLTAAIAAATTTIVSIIPTPTTAKAIRSDVSTPKVTAGQGQLLNCTLPGNDSSRVTYLEWSVEARDISSVKCVLYLKKSVRDDAVQCRQQFQPLGIVLEERGLSLIIADVRVEHEGRYRCLSYEGSDSYEMLATLSVMDKPSEPRSLRHTKYDATWVELAWDPPLRLHHLPVDRYELAAWPVKAAAVTPAPAAPAVPEDAVWRPAVAASSHFSGRVSDLFAYTEYCFAARAVNSIGAGPPTLLCSVRTREQPPLQGAATATSLGANTTAAEFAFRYHPDLMLGRFKALRVRTRLLRYWESAGISAFSEESPSLSTVTLGAELFSGTTKRNWVLTELQPYSQYSLSYTVENDRYSGPEEHLLFNTTEDFAPAPALQEQWPIFDTNLTLKWYHMSRIPGHVLSYTVSLSRFPSSESLGLKNVSADRSEIQLTGLQPLTKYNVTVAAVTRLGLGRWSNAHIATTDASWPSAPQDVQYDNSYSGGLIVSWARSRFTVQRPDLPRSALSNREYPPHKLLFRVEWRYRVSGRSQDITGVSRQFGPLNELQECRCIPDLWRPRSPNAQCRAEPDRLCVLIPWSELAFGYPEGVSDLTTRFYITVHSLGKSSVGSNYPGHVSVRIVADIPYTYLFDGVELPSKMLEQPVIVGIAVGAVTVLLAFAVIVFLLWKWLCSHRGYQRPLGGETIEFLEHEYNGTHSSGPRPQFRPYSQTEFTPLSLTDFRQHVLDSHANDNSAFQVHFEDVQRSTHKDWPATQWKLPENLAKNRYTDIYPFDHSRVILCSNSGKKRGDYINANYVDGYHRPKAYIACQGPVPSTFDDFWLMVWENKTTVVVMISNFVERGRRKCDQYWPNSGSQVYGHVTVKFIRQASKAAYCLRVFGIRDNRAKKSVKERLVYHYLYSEWPDYGVPQYPLPVLNFVQKCIHFATQLGPIVVHCSAGVGRTGTFICIEAQIRQILEEKTVNVRGFLEHIRQQRMRLVQTEEQYVFIHDVLLEFLLCPEREVARERLPAYVTSLQDQEPCGCTRLETQYQLCVSEHQPSAHEFTSAKKPCNSAKNRDLILPIESRRVKLTAEPGVEGSDYINASHMHGYYSMNEYIVTQYPKENTVYDFFKLIWDYNCSFVVNVHTEEEDDDEPLPAVWPSQEEDMRESEHLQLYFRSREELPYAVRQEFLMATKRDDYSLVTTMWTLKRWPELLGQSLDMMKLIRDISERRACVTSPLIVVDTYGGSFAGIFSALYTMYHQLQQENSVDVYSLFKMYHLQRPGIFNSQADLQFIYEVIEFHAKLSSPSNSLSLRRSHHGNGTLGSSAATAAQESQQLPAAAPESTATAIAGQQPLHSPHAAQNGAVNAASAESPVEPSNGSPQQHLPPQASPQPTVAFSNGAVGNGVGGGGGGGGGTEGLEEEERTLEEEA